MSPCENLTLRELAALLGDCGAVKIRFCRVDGRKLYEVEIHEDHDGFGVNAHGVDEDLEKATRIALDDLDDAIAEDWFGGGE